VTAGEQQPAVPRQPRPSRRVIRAARPRPRATRKYQALLTALPSGDSDGQPSLPWPAVRAVVRARDHRTSSRRLFTALVSTEDGAEPAHSRVIATMVVLGSQPDDCLGIGDSFTLWRGADVARGVITRRLFT
jgi:hypothetical protein